MKQQTPEVGNNRTGIESHPLRTRNMIRGMEEFPPSSKGNGRNVAAVRIDYAQFIGTSGSMPPIGEEEVSDAMIMFMDKLGARAAFERTGVRIYEALISKHEAYGSFEGGPTRKDLEDIRGQELDHFHLICQAIEELEGDPTAVTPSANLVAGATSGMVTTVVDPRTSLVDSLEAALMVELTDHESWEALVDLARSCGKDEMAKKFADALSTEEEHLENVRRWLSAAHKRVRTH